MKFLLLDATGTTGLRFIDQALAAGHEVVAMVRNREKLQERQGLHIAATRAGTFRCGCHQGSSTGALRA
jgi:uncharacterized protein YbjT (DUF2867 family)